MGGGYLVAILYKANETDFSNLGLGVLNEAISILITEERNGIFELEMKYPTTANRFKDLKLDRLIKVDANHKLKDQRFKIIRISKPMDGVVTVFAEHISYLSQDLALKPSVSYSGNANAALTIWKNNMVDAHPFTVYSDIATTGSGKWSIKDLENARQALGGISGSILDSYGGEYEFDNYDIRLYANRGRQSDMLIAYGRNLTELTQEETIDSTFTSIYPYTITTENETDTILTLPEFFVDSQYVGNFARRKIMKVDFSQDGVTTVEQLRAKANAYILANGIGIPKVNLKVKYIDLAKSLDYKDTQSIEEVNLCDWVTVYFENFDIQTNAKIIKVVWDEILDQYDSIEIGEARANLSNAVNTAIDGKLETIVQNVNTVQRAANGKNKVYRGIEEPLYGVLNDLWYKPVGSGEVEMYIHNGIVWHLEKYSGDAIDGTINFANVNGINFNANNVVSGTFDGLTFTNPYSNSEISGTTTLKGDLTSNYTKTNGDYGTMVFSKDRFFSNLYSPDGSLIRGHNLSAEALNFNSSFGNATYNFDNISVTRADGASSAITWAYSTFPMQIYSTQHTELGISINGVRSSRIEYGGAGSNAFVKIKGNLDLGGNNTTNLSDLIWDDSTHIKRGTNSLDVSAKAIFSVGLSGFAGMYLSRNTETGDNALDLYATLNMQGHVITNTSDERLKLDIVDYPQKAVDVFRKIKPRNFKWRDTNRFGSQTETGFIAQEIKEIDPTLVTQTKDDKSEDGISWVINETDFNRKSWIAVHELVLEVDRLTEENNTMRQELEDIKKHLGLS